MQKPRFHVSLLGPSLLIILTLLSISYFTNHESSHVISKTVANHISNNNYGIADGSINNIPQNQLAIEFKGIASLGFTWVRFDFAWNTIQPKSISQYNWAQYDYAVALAMQDHLKVLGILDYAPAWAAHAGCVNQTNCAPADPLQFATYAATVAAHFKSSVNYWEIWNEENVSKYWSPAPSATNYELTLRTSYEAIKATNPDAFVMVGGLASGDGNTTLQIDAVQYLQELYALGAKGSFDGIAYHPYSYPETASDEVITSGWAKMSETTPSLRSVMILNGDASKQIWITEYGAPTDGPSKSLRVSESAQAKEARSAYRSIENKTWIGPFFWYSYQDIGSDSSNNENFFGLVRANGSDKPAYYTWQKLLKQNQ